MVILSVGGSLEQDDQKEQDQNNSPNLVLARLHDAIEQNYHEQGLIYLLAQFGS